MTKPTSRWRTCLSCSLVCLALLALPFAWAPLLSLKSGLAVRRALHRAGVHAARVVLEPEPTIIDEESREDYEQARFDRFFGRGIDDWDVHLPGQEKSALSVAIELGHDRPLAVHFTGDMPALPGSGVSFERDGAVLLARWWGVSPSRLTLWRGCRHDGPRSSNTYWRVDGRPPLYLSIYTWNGRVSQMSSFAICPVRSDAPTAADNNHH